MSDALKHRWMPQNQFLTALCGETRESYPFSDVPVPTPEQRKLQRTDLYGTPTCPGCVAAVEVENRRIDAQTAQLRAEMGPFMQ